MFGRIDDDRPWRVGLYGIDDGGDQLVIDWRARFAERFYQATLRRAARASTRGSATSAASTTCSSRTSPPARSSGTSPLLAELSQHRGSDDARRGRHAAVRAGPRSCASTRARGSCCGAGRAPARPSSASTAPRGSSTTTAASPPTASSCSARATGSCASSRRCCRRSARPASMQTTFDRCSARRPRPAATSGGSTCSTRSRRRCCGRPTSASVRITVPEDEVAELFERFARRGRCRGVIGASCFVDSLVARCPGRGGARATAEVVDGDQAGVAVGARRSRRGRSCAAGAALRGARRDRRPRRRVAGRDGDGALLDEVRARFEGVPRALLPRRSSTRPRTSRCFQLRAVHAPRRRAHARRRRRPAVATRSGSAWVGPRELLDAELGRDGHRLPHVGRDRRLAQRARRATGIDAVELLGIRPTGRAVREVTVAAGDRASTMHTRRRAERDGGAASR